MHVAIIMDGNRRYAKSRNLPAVFGHAMGMRNLVKITKACVKNDIHTLTVYALSTENLIKRNADEVSNILNLIADSIKKHKKMLIGNNVRVKILGKLNSLPEKIANKLDELVDQTKNGKDILLQICLNYGGRDEIIRSVNEAIKNGEKEFDEDTINKYLDSSLQPDLIIRPGGETRISNFLTWQGVYSEYYFSDKYWPEFDEKELKKAIATFNKKERRFGK
jgi:undecaprenyl diphosphate synthase